MAATAPRLGRFLKNVALCCAFTGLALELGGGITGQWLAFRIGLFLFLAAFPLYLLGLFLGRR